MALVPKVSPGDWAKLQRTISQLASTKLGPESTPTFAGISVGWIASSSAIISSYAGSSATISSYAGTSATISSIAFTSETGVSLGVTSATISSLSFLSATGIAGSSFGVVSANVSSMVFTSIYGTDATIDRATITTLASQSASISAVTFNSAHGTTFSVVSATISSMSLTSGTFTSFSAISATVSSLAFTSGIFTSIGGISATLSCLWVANAIVTNQLAVGVSVPDTEFSLTIARTSDNVADGANICATGFGSSSPVPSPVFNGRHAFGTITAPMPVSVEDIRCFLFAANACWSSVPPYYGTVGTMDFRTAGAQNTTSTPGYIRFDTCSPGTIVRAERTRINEDGQVLVGTITAYLTTTLFEVKGIALCSLIRANQVACITATSYTSDARPGIAQIYTQAGTTYAVPMLVEAYGTTLVAQIVMGASAGSATGPLATISGQRLCVFNPNSYNSNTGWVAAGGLGFAAAEAITSVARGSTFYIATISLGGTGNQYRVMVDSAGKTVVGTNVGSYIAPPTGKAQLDVRGSLAAGETTAAYFAVSSIGSLQYMGVATAIITAITNNQMTMAQDTTGITFRVQGNDGIWRSATLALTS